MENQSTTWNIRSQKDICLNGFADDHAVKKEFTPTKVDDDSQCIFSLEQCLINIEAWMDIKRLRMNDGKWNIFCLDLGPGSPNALLKC